MPKSIAKEKARHEAVREESKELDKVQALLTSDRCPKFYTKSTGIHSLHFSRTAWQIGSAKGCAQRFAKPVKNVKVCSITFWPRPSQKSATFFARTLTRISPRCSVFPGIALG